MSGLWGAQDPETKEFFGAVEVMRKGLFDFCFANIVMNPRRFEIIDYMQPISFMRLGFAIRSKTVEKISWTTYISPIHNLSWFVIILFSLVIFVMIVLVLSLLHVKSDKFDILWAMMASVFGIGVINHHEDSYGKTTKILFVLSFVVGNIYFSFYQAFLTSSLAVPSNYRPFYAPEMIPQTNFK